MTPVSRARPTRAAPVGTSTRTGKRFPRRTGSSISRYEANAIATDARVPITRRAPRPAGPVSDRSHTKIGQWNR